MTLTFTVAGKPIPQPRSRSAAGKRPYVSEDHPIRKWRGLVWTACFDETVRRELPRPCYWGKIGMTVLIWGARASADIDNLFKGIADAITGVAYVDDSQIAKLYIERRKADKANPPGAIIEIEEIS